MLLQHYRNAWSGLDRPVWLLAGVMLINRSGTMVLPYLSLYLTQHLHFSVEEAGAVLAIYGLGAMIGTYVGGKLTDRIGFYWIQVASLFFGGFMLVGLQFATSLGGVCGLVFVFTLLGDSFRPANAAALAHYSHPDTRTRAYSLNRLAINLGWAVGGSIGGVLAGIDYRLLFWVDGLTCMAAAVYLLYALPRPSRTAAGQRTQAVDAEPVVSPWRDRLYLGFMVGVVAYAIAFMQFFSTVPLYLKTVLRVSEAHIGLLNAFNGLLIVVVEMPLIYWLEQRLARRLGVAAGGMLLTMLAWLALTQVGLPGVSWLSVFFLTMGEMLAMPFLLTFAANRAAARNRGQYMGVYSMGWALAQVSSPFLGTQLIDRFGFNALWLVMAALCILGASIMTYLRRRV